MDQGSDVYSSIVGEGSVDLLSVWLHCFGDVTWSDWL